ncbi:MAG: hypothetical protein IKT33_03630 [Clostridia bacterium]|nr:hypothetical protein [Clostridia bacterium]
MQKIHTCQRNYLCYNNVMKINSDELKKGFALQGDRLITLPGNGSNKEVAELHPDKALFRDEKFQQAFALYQRMREASQTQTVNQVQEDVQDRENN